jgi:Raf kinase inhibitor-like YbhB/YbcL family protein
MKFKTLACLTFVLVAALMIPWSNARADGKFRLSSTTFANKATLPLSTIDNILQNGVNICSINGSPGGDQSPELSWSSPPIGTRSFVVVLYDVTAAFTHWGMYNISPTVTRLPENAGVVGSMYGDQIVNDFPDAKYDGPCPPPGVAPVVHEYVFTVYALATKLNLPSSTNFPANSETLYQALIKSGRDGDILDSASLIGLYSTTPPN